MKTNSDRSTAGIAWLALRSLLWAALLPGVVAGYVPWRYFGLGAVPWAPFRARHGTGLMLIALGVVFLATCIWEFARRGGGTLGPPDAPGRLVVRGLYRYVRNPMYLSVSMILLGESLLVGSPGLIVYWAIWFIIANLFVIGYEEPALRRRFGSPYERYCLRVGRWLPRLPRRDGRD